MRNALLIGAIAFTASTLIAQSNSPGSVSFSILMPPSLNSYISPPTSSTELWFQTNVVRMGVFSPYFDSFTSWYPNGLVYQDLYGIQPGSAVFNQHPEWILQDQYGNWLYIPFDCYGTCSSYAGDISNPAFRAWWISQAQAIFTRGNYRGLWIDDVNMNFNVSDGNGNLVEPIDFNTGLPMTYTAWRAYTAQFLQQIRQSFPSRELIENSVWFAGPTGVQDADPYIQQQLATATNVNLERGIASDPGLTGGTGPWSVYAFFAYVDLVHSIGPGVTFGEYQVSSTQQQYGLASYFMISNGNDRLGDLSTTPGNWWSGYSVALGAPLGPRTYNNGVFQRNFANGIVLLGEPGLSTQTVSVPGTYQTLSGTIVNSSVNISALQGIILLAQSSSAPPPPPPGSGITRYLSSITPSYVFNSWGVLHENTSIEGNPITLDGVVYPEGMGVHAYSELHFPMYGNCSSMSATVGVDDEIPAGLGNLDFQVWADGKKLYDSGYLQSGSPAPSFQVNLTGYQTLGLVVTNGIYQAAPWRVPVDHADWAGAIITCAN
jgi:hypothetical protein